MIKQTVKIPITPGAELASELKNRIGEMIGPDLGKTKIIEKGGMNLLGGVYKSDPFKQSGCRWGENCMVDGAKDCMDNNIVYKISCKQCTDAHNDAQGQDGDGIQEVTQRGPQGILQQGQVDGQVHDGIQEVTQSGPQEIL